MNAKKNKAYLNWFIFTVLLTCATFLTSFFPLWANVPINIIAPRVVLFVCKMVMFERLKLSTLIKMRTLIVLVLFNLMNGDLFVKIVLIFLVINILEATFTDLLKNKQPYNFVTGLVLAASVFCLAGSWLPEYMGPLTGIYKAEAGVFGEGLFASKNVFMLGTVCWILAYTIWNWLFVIGEFSPSIALEHVGILLMPLLGICITGTPGFWLVFRANSLTTGGVFQISCKKFIENEFKHESMIKLCEKIKTSKVQCILMIVNLILMAVPIIMFFTGKGF